MNNRSVTILLQGRRVELAKADADRMAETGVRFAYLCKRDGRTMTVITSQPMQPENAVARIARS